MEKLKSRKLWITIGTFAATLANDLFDLGISTEAGVGLALVVATYLFGQSWVDKTEVNAVADFTKAQAINYAQALERRIAELEGVPAAAEITE